MRQTLNAQIEAKHIRICKFMHVGCNQNTHWSQSPIPERLACFAAGPHLSALHAYALLHPWQAALQTLPEPVVFMRSKSPRQLAMSATAATWLVLMGKTVAMIGHPLM